MDGLIGAMDDRVALALFGLTVATGALSLRWWQFQRMPAKLPEQPAIVYLKQDQADSPVGIPQGALDSYPERFPQVSQPIHYPTREE